MRAGLIRGLVPVAVMAATLAGLLLGAPQAVAASSAPSSAPSSASSSASSSPAPGPAHPDLDYLGATVRAHETPAGGQRAATVQPLATTTTSTPGLDVSHYQGTVDWNSVAANGAKFAYMKATEGTTFTDPQFATNYAGSAGAGLARGAYHFALPDTSPAAAQAQFFLDNGGGWVGDGHTLPPVIDIEYNPYGTADWTGYCYEMAPAQMVAWLSDFSTTVHDETNRWPVIYTTAEWWANCTGNDTTLAANDPLWIAHASTDPGTIPSGWSGYTFWQYASSGTYPGDQDWFNGSVDQLDAFATAGTDKIVTHYDAVGGAGSYLGSPSGGEYPTAHGWAQNYAQGVIYYAPATGAWAVHGLILSHYQQLGGPGGVLGFPVTDENGTPDGVGRYNHFNGSGGASIYWTPNTGAWSIHGEIRAKWASLGWERSALSYPTTDENGTPDGIGRYNHFNGTGGASIYWTPSTGAHSVQGAIHARWAALGWEAGPMGYPVTDETPTPDGVGRYNHFSKSASIYWSPGTGAWSVHGAIRDRWASMGWERSALGYPTSDEYGVTGGRRNTFQHGYITWYSSNGSTQVSYY